MHEHEVLQLFFTFDIIGDMEISNTLRNVEICLTNDTLATILGVPRAGIQNIKGCKETGEFTKLVIKRVAFKRARLHMKFLKGEYQLIFEFMNKVMVCRTNTNNQICC